MGMEWASVDKALTGPWPTFECVQSFPAPSEGHISRTEGASAWCRGSRLVIHKCRAIVTC